MAAARCGVVVWVPPLCYYLGAAARRRGRQGHDESDSFHNSSSELSNRRHALVIQEVSWISQKVSRWRSSRGFHRRTVSSLGLPACLPVWRLSSRCLFTSFSNCHFDDARMVLYSYFGLCLSFQFSLFPTSRRPVIVFQLLN